MLISLFVCMCVPSLKAGCICPPGRVSLLGVRGQRRPAGWKAFHWWSTLSICRLKSICLHAGEQQIRLRHTLLPCGSQHLVLIVRALWVARTTGTGSNLQTVLFEQTNFIGPGEEDGIVELVCSRPAVGWACLSLGPCEYVTFDPSTRNMGNGWLKGGVCHLYCPSSQIIQFLHRAPNYNLSSSL